MRAMIVLRMCNIDFLVKHNQQILQVMRKFLGASLFKRLLKSTFYGHFVAGEDRNDVSVLNAFNASNAA
jgi:hypothetical protein